MMDLKHGGEMISSNFGQFWDNYPLSRNILATGFTYQWLYLPRLQPCYGFHCHSFQFPQV